MIKTICIAGKNNIAIEVAEYISETFPFCNIIAVCNLNDKGENSFQRSFKAYCDLKNIQVLQLCEVYELEELLFLSLEFDRILKPQNFKSEKLFNIHFSLLPAYKGMYTSAVPILNNEKYSGVTLHKIDKGIDTGDIIAQTKFEIGSDTSGQELYLKYIAEGTRLVIDNLPNIISDKVVSFEQPSVNASYYSKSYIDYSNLKININKTAQEIHNQVRAFSFPAYQLPLINDAVIYESEIMTSKSCRKAGEILYEDEFILIISTIDFDIKLKKDRRKDLLEAVAKGNMEVIKLFSDAGYPLFQKNKLGWDALIVATYNGHFEIMKSLIEEYGGDVNTTNNNLTTLSMYAMTNASLTDNLQLLSYLLEHTKVNLYCKDAFGKDIYFYAKKYNNKNVLIILKCQ